MHPDEEQDDVDRIKEESRRRRQAILEKYKKQQMQQGTEPKLQSEEAGKGSYQWPSVEYLFYIDCTCSLVALN